MFARGAFHATATRPPKRTGAESRPIKKRADTTRKFVQKHAELLRHFVFREFDMLAQFRVVFAELHLALGIFGLVVFGSRVEIAGFFVFQLYYDFIAFFRCHFITPFIISRDILSQILLEIK
jgi:hypothetical protein